MRHRPPSTGMGRAWARRPRWASPTPRRPAEPGGVTEDTLTRAPPEKPGTGRAGYPTGTDDGPPPASTTWAFATMAGAWEQARRCAATLCRWRTTGGAVGLHRICVRRINGRLPSLVRGQGYRLALPPMSLREPGEPDATMLHTQPGRPPRPSAGRDPAQPYGRAVSC